uniref:Uncharacterized protein n=1 Tax=Arundo donax TaxID=35708 RepID=A0A0A8YQ03_ARUDO
MWKQGGLRKEICKS